MCAAHLHRLAKYGSLDLPPGHRPLIIGRSVAERIAAYSEVKPNGCIEWTGYVSAGGYGKIDIGSSPKYAHRVNYELQVGPIPRGLQLDHLCRNRRCINPSHLEPVTQRENLLRGATIPAARVAQTHCVNGHPFDEANTGRKRNGTRFCRTCNRNGERRRRAALRAAS